MLFRSIDIIIEKEKIIPIEVKFKQKLKSEDFKGIEIFLKEYPKIKKSYLINLGIQKDSKKTSLLLPYSLSRIS